MLESPDPISESDDGMMTFSADEFDSQQTQFAASGSGTASGVGPSGRPSGVPGEGPMVDDFQIDLGRIA